MRDIPLELELVVVLLHVEEVDKASFHDIRGLWLILLAHKLRKQIGGIWIWWGKVYTWTRLWWEQRGNPNCKKNWGVHETVKENRICQTHKTESIQHRASRGHHAGWKVCLHPQCPISPISPYTHWFLVKQ